MPVASHGTPFDQRHNEGCTSAKLFDGLPRATAGRSWGRVGTQRGSAIPRAMSSHTCWRVTRVDRRGRIWGLAFDLGFDITRRPRRRGAVHRSPTAVGRWCAMEKTDIGTGRARWPHRARHRWRERGALGALADALGGGRAGREAPGCAAASADASRGPPHPHVATVLLASLCSARSLHTSIVLSIVARRARERQAERRTIWAIRRASATSAARLARGCSCTIFFFSLASLRRPLIALVAAAGRGPEDRPSPARDQRNALPPFVLRGHEIRERTTPAPADEHTIPLARPLFSLHPRMT
jgi:hypothetical protein